MDWPNLLLTEYISSHAAERLGCGTILAGVARQLEVGTPDGRIKVVLISATLRSCSMQRPFGPLTTHFGPNYLKPS
jgi:hypothetical protein